jgi:hypothetical protein
MYFVGVHLLVPLLVPLFVHVIAQGPTGATGLTGNTGFYGQMGAPGDVNIGPTGATGLVGASGISITGATGPAGENVDIQGSFNDQRFEDPQATGSCANSALWVCDFDQTEWITVVNRTDPVLYTVQAMSSLRVKTRNISLSTPRTLTLLFEYKDRVTPQTISVMCEGSVRALNLSTIVLAGPVICNVDPALRIQFYSLNNLPTNENWVEISFRITYFALL